MDYLILFLICDRSKNANSLTDSEYQIKIGGIKVIVHRPIPDGFTIKTVYGYYITLSLDDKTIPAIKAEFNPDK